MNFKKSNLKVAFLKLTVLALVFLFVLQPLAPVLATNEKPAPESETVAADDTQEIAPEPPAEVPEEGAVLETEETGEAEPEDNAEKLTADDPEPQAAPPSAPLTQKLPEIDKNTGALNYGYQIVVPPGRNNMQPSLSLSYNSSSGEQNSIFGYGWSISIPYIQRLNKAGVEKLYGSASEKYFYSSLDGELSNVSGSSYIARTDNGSFNKYEFFDNYWLVTAKDGTQYKFGSDDNSKQNSPLNPENVYKWKLKEIRDTNNNYISYEYFKDAGQIYPLVIKYTGNGSTDGIFEIDFQRTPRENNIAFYSTGFTVGSNYVISEINAKINGSWVNKYVLTYGQSPNTNKMLLNSITASGRDINGNITTLPPTAFNYQSSGSGWAQTSGWNLPPVPPGETNWGYPGIPPQFADLNGDSLIDLIIVASHYDRGNVITYYRYLNNGSGWTQTSNWNLPPVPPGETNWLYPSTPPQFADLNGDGLTDVLLAASHYDMGNIITYYIYLNNGSGWARSPLWDFPPVPAGEESWNFFATPPQFTDLNGDGLIDVTLSARHYYQGNVITYYFYLNNGSGWTRTSLWNFPPLPSGETDWAYSTYQPQFLDLNGDGLTDVLLVASHYDRGNVITYHRYLNNGSGWTQTSNWNLPPVPPGETNWLYPSTPPQFADLNGDGLTDVLLAASHYDMGNIITYYIYLNNGSGWARSPLWDFPPVPAGEESWNFFATPPQFTDLNGDGLIDVTLSARHYYQGNVITYYFYLNNREKGDVLDKIVYPYGGSTQVVYKPAAQYKDSLGNISNKAPYPIYTASQIINNDGFGGGTSLSNQFEGGHYYYNNPFDKQFSGYDSISQTDKAGYVAKTYYHNGKDNYFKIGKPYKTEQYDNLGKLYQTSINKWEASNLSAKAGFVKMAETVQMDFDGQAGHRDKAESYLHDNSNGNQIQKIEWGEVVAASDGSFSDTGSDKYITNITYASNPASKVVSKPSLILLSGQAGNKIKESKFFYDDLPFGDIGLGNETAKEDWIKNLSYAKTYNFYNSYGLVTKAIDANNNATNFVYDNYNLYPKSVTNAAGQTTTYAYNYANGKVGQVTDANGFVFLNVYDGLGRIAKELVPDEASPANLVLKTEYVYTDNSLNASVEKKDYLDSFIFVSNYSYYDGLGKAIQIKKSAENNNFIANDFVYDNRGNLQKESLPYFTLGYQRALPTSNAQLYNVYAYDALNRKISATNAAGTTLYNYKNWQVTATDANGNKKDFIYDAKGNLLRVDEYNGPQVYTTLYEYNGIGNLIKITDALENVRNFAYDGLGRRLAAEDLHKSTDFVFGTWSYAYDNNGNIVNFSDPKGQVINYTYDKLNRKTSEDYLGQEGIELTFVYDDCLNGIGRLCKSVSKDLIDEYEYSANGNVTKNIRSVDDKNFATKYAFDGQQNQTLITNPDNSQVKYDYNLAGLVEKVWRKESTDAGFIAVANNFDYSPAGQITAVNYSNGIQTSNTYDANKLYRLLNKVSVKNGANIQDISYQYDNVGNIIKIVDNSASDVKKTVDYTYDNLYRLLSAKSTNTAFGGDYTQSFTYDALGNILSKKLGEAETIYSYGKNPDAVISIKTAGLKPAPVILYLNASPAQITAGQQVVLSWALSGGEPTSLSADNGIGSVLGQNFVVVNPAVTTTYVLTASNESGSATKSVTIFVSSARTLGSQVSLIDTEAPKLLALAGQPYIKLFMASSTRISLGQSVRISWRISGGEPTSLTIDNGIGSVLGLTGKTIAPKVTTKYTLTAKNSYGTATRSLTIYVDTIPPVISNFTATPASIAAGQSAVLSWALSGGAATSLSIDNKIGSVLGKKSFTVKPIITTTYVLTAKNSLGTVIKPVTVVVLTNTPPTENIKNFKYDQNGNMISETVGTLAETAYTYDYNNRLASVTNPSTGSGSSSTYAYDSLGQRIKYALTGANPSVTYYPSMFYNLASSLPAGNTTITKHVFANGLMLATVTGTGTAASINTILTDHLSGSSVVLDPNSQIIETTDYYPFGEIRLDNKTTAFSEQRKFIGQEYDQDTGLSYLNARYYNSSISRFLSQDPVAFADFEKVISDPQQLNLYSYARNNPLTWIDSNGKYAELVFVACGPLGLGAHGYINIVPEQGADLSQYNINGGDGSHYTIGGYPSEGWHGELQAKINESGNYNTSSSQRLNTIPLVVPNGMTTAQYDQSLLKAGYNLSQKDLGHYFGLGRPTGYDANSGNTWTQVITDAGGTVPKIPIAFIQPIGYGTAIPHFPYGSGHPINTQWLATPVVQAAQQTVSYASQAISHISSSTSSATLNAISATLSRISSIISSLKNK